MTTKSVVTAVVVVSLIVTHAAFVDYRSWNPASRRTSILSAATETMVLLQQQNGYLQDRKYASVELCACGCYRGGRCWRGDARTRWMGSGLCSGVFELLVVMKGGHTRLLILDALAHQPKNKLQLAAQLAIDWKAIDRHMKKLLEYSLVEAYITVGTCTLFIITEKGKHALTLAGQYYRLDSIY